MSDNIWRWSSYLGRNSVALTTSLTTTPEIDISQAASGAIHIPSGSSITSLTFYGAPCNSIADPGLPAYAYAPYYDLTGTGGSGVAIVVDCTAPGAYQIPALCMSSRGLKIVANANGTVDISLKG